MTKPRVVLGQERQSQVLSSLKLTRHFQCTHRQTWWVDEWDLVCDILCTCVCVCVFTHPRVRAWCVCVCTCVMCGVGMYVHVHMYSPLLGEAEARAWCWDVILNCFSTLYLRQDSSLNLAFVFWLCWAGSAASSWNPPISAVLCWGLGSLHSHTQSFPRILRIQIQVLICTASTLPWVTSHSPKWMLKDTAF